MKKAVFLESVGIGGALCLDFINTVGGFRGRETEEGLQAYPDFLSFASTSGALAPGEAGMLEKLAANDAEGAALALDEAKGARENLFRLFQAAFEKRNPDPRDLEEFNGRLAEALSFRALGPGGAGLAWTWRGMGTRFASPLWPILKDAGELLTSERLRRLGECRSETCGWLFLDETKNRTRQWCDMKTCGNRAKARRHRTRNQKAA